MQNTMLCKISKPFYMKNILKALLLILGVVLSSTSAQAQVITAERAKEIANTFFASGAQKSAAARTMAVQEKSLDNNVLSEESNDNEAPTYHVLTAADGKGFIIVSGEEIENPIIGYSFDSEFITDGEQPAGLVDYLANIDAEIRALREYKAANPQKSAARTAMQRTNYNATSMGEQVVLLETAKWGQNAPFNAQCWTTAEHTTQAKTGCVPTAFAIIMRYHEWPIVGTGAIQDCQDAVLPYTYYDNRTYDYSKMPLVYDGNWTAEQQNEVAKLMSHLGHAFGASYSTGSTEVNMSNTLTTATKNYFNYKDCSISNQYDNGSLADFTEWKNKLKNSLDNNCPVPYGANNIGSGTVDARHMFVVDGYTADDYFHFNFGWNGGSNGWYKLDAVTVGYSWSDDANGYTSKHQAFFNLTPNKVEYPVSVSVSPADAGTVSINGGEASATINANYYEGQNITLRTTNNSGYTFSHWSKNGEVISEQETCTVKVGTDANNYVANYNAISTTETIDVTVTYDSTMGSVTYGGNTVGTSIAPYKYSEVTLTATAKDGCMFTGWTVANGTETTKYTTTDITFIAKNSIEVTANFALAGGEYSMLKDNIKVSGDVRNNIYSTWTYDIEKDPSKPAAIELKTTNGSTEVCALASTSNRFYAGAYNAAGSRYSNITYTLTAPEGFVITGYKLTYVVQASYTGQVTVANSSGSQTPNDTKSHELEYKYTPENGSTSNGVKSTTFTMSTTAAATPYVTVTGFTVNVLSDSATGGGTTEPETPTTYTVSVTATEGGSAYIGTGTSATVTAGNSVKLTATANDGYTFDGWYNGATKVSDDLQYTFTPTASGTYQAKFTANATPEEPGETTGKTLNVTFSGNDDWTRYDGSNIGTESWAFKAVTKTTPAVTVQVNGTKNNLGFSTINDVKHPYLYKGTNFVITIPEPYKITGYKLTVKGNNFVSGTYTYTTGATTTGTGTITQNNVEQTVSATGLDTNTININVAGGSLTGTAGIIITALELYYTGEEVEEPEEQELHPDGAYKIYWQKDNRGYLAYHNTTWPNEAVLADVTLGSYGSSHYNSTTDPVDLVWYLITADDGKRYLFEAETGKFLGVNTGLSTGGGKANKLSTTEAWPIAIEENTKHAGHYIITTIIDGTNNLLCSGCGSSSKNGAHPVRWLTVNDTNQNDGGAPLQLVGVDGVTVTESVMNTVLRVINGDNTVPFKVEVQNLRENDPNTHFGTITVGGTTVKLTPDHLTQSEIETTLVTGSTLNINHKYRGFEFNGFYIGSTSLGENPTLTDEQIASMSDTTPLVAKFTATNTGEATLFTAEDEFSYRIPAIVKTGTGRLIAVTDYRHNLDDIGRDKHGTGKMRIDLVARTSDDNGATWTAKQTIAAGDESKTGSYQRAYGDAAIAAVGQNIVVMAAAGDVMYANASATNTNKMVRIFSSDNGASWNIEDMTTKMYSTQTSLFPNHFSAFFGSGKLAVDYNFNGTSNARIYGALLMKNSSSSYNNYVVYSDDLGASWSILGGSQDAVAGGDEPKVEILPSGQILLSARRQGGRIFRVFTYGTDKANGEGSWGDAAVNGCDNGGSNGTNGEIICLDAKRPNGVATKILLQSQPKGGSGHYERYNVTIWYKEITDETQTPSSIASGWTQGLEVCPAGVKSAYSAMALQANGEIAFFFEEAPCYADNHEKGYSMVYVPLTIEEITNNNFLNPNAEVEATTVNVELTDNVGNKYNHQFDYLPDNVDAALTAVYPFITLGAKGNLQQTGDKAYTYTNTVTLPFKVSNDEKTYWHNIYWPANQNPGFYPIYMSASVATDTYVSKVTETKVYGESQYNTLTNADKLSWAVYSVNNTLTFKFKNKVTGKFIQVTGVSSSNTQNAKYVAETDATVFTLLKDGGSYAGDYALKASVGGEEGYLCSTSAGYSYATHYPGTGHPGAWVKFVEAPDYQAIVNALTESIAQFGDGEGKYIANESVSNINTTNIATMPLNTLNTHTETVQTVKDSYRKIELSVNNVNGGTVSIAGEAVNSKYAPLNADIEILATPADGYSFTGWYNGTTKVSDEKSYTVTVSEAMSLTANFGQESYTVSVEAGEGGTATVAKGTSPGASEVTVEYGGSVTISATPANGYRFVNWTKNGNVTSTDATVVVENITVAAHYVANFELIPPTTYTITAAANPAEGGTATVAVGASSGSSTVVVAEGGSITLTAAANAGYSFVEWRKNGAFFSNQAGLVVEGINSNADYVAYFTKSSYTIATTANFAQGGEATVSIGANSPTTSVTASYGDYVTLYATPATGYNFVNWTKDGNVISTSATYNVPESVTGNATYVANFAIGEIFNATFEGADWGTPVDDYTDRVVTATTQTAPAITIAATEGNKIGSTTVGSTQHPYLLNNNSFTITVEGKRIKGYILTVIGLNFNGTFTYTVAPQMARSSNGTATVGVSEPVTVSASGLDTDEINIGVSAGEQNSGIIVLDAQFDYVEEPATDEFDGKWFRIKCGYGYMNVANTTVHNDGTNGGVDIIAKAVNSHSQVFKFVKNGDGYTLQSKDGNYIVGRKWNVDASGTESSVFNFEKVGDNKYHINWNNTLEGGIRYFKAEGVGTKYYPFCDVNKSTDATKIAEWTLEEVTYSTISTEANPGTAGTAVISVGTSEKATFDAENGSTVTLIATPNTNYNFVNWTKSGAVVGTDATIQVNVAATAHYVANFEQKAATTYTVKVTADPGTNGEATASAATVVEGGSVTLTATPYTGYIFKGWYNGANKVSDANPYTINNVTENIAYTAIFEKENTGGGTATGGEYIVVYENGKEQVTGRKSEWAYNFNNEYPAQLTLKATDATGTPVNAIVMYNDRLLAGAYDDNSIILHTPVTYTLSIENDGYYIVGYSIKYKTTNNHVITIKGEKTTQETDGNKNTSYTFKEENLQTKTTEFTMSAEAATVNHSITFSEFIVYVASSSCSVSVAPNDANYGTALVSVGTSAGATNVTITSGSSVSLVAEPNVGYHFVNWTLNGTPVSNNASCEISNVTTNRHYVANFAKNIYTITAAPSPANGGTATVSSENVEHGGSVTLTAHAEPGYLFSHWTKDGNTIEGAAATHVVENVTESALYIAHFTHTGNYYTISANVTTLHGNNGGIATPAYANPGDNATLVAIPNTGYRFVAWYDEQGNKVSEESTLIIENVTADATYRAEFIKQIYIRVRTVTNGYATVYMGDMMTNIEGYYDYGSKVTIKAYVVYPGDDVFAYWSFGGVKLSQDAEYTFEATDEWECVPSTHSTHTADECRNGTSCTEDHILEGDCTDANCLSCSKCFIANFNYKASVAVESADDSNGSVYIETPGTTIKETATGNSVTITAHPESGFAFDYWTLKNDANILSYSSSYTLVLNAAPRETVTYVAHFRQLTQLENGKAYRIISVAGTTPRYIHRNNGNGLASSTNKEDGEIFIAQQDFSNGGFNLISAVGDYGWQHNGTLGNEYTTINTTSGVADGTFTLYSTSGTECNTYKTNGAGELGYYSSATGVTKGTDSDFIFEEVPFTFNVNIANGSNAKLGTINLPFAVTVHPSVTVYGVFDTDENSIYLNPIALDGNVLPANTPVIIEAEQEGVYGFTPAPTSRIKIIINTGLEGTLAAETIDAGTNAYILSYDGPGTRIKMYKLAADSRKINANKAYYVDATGRASALEFKFVGTTGVDDVEREGIENTIYDLKGRRLTEITEPGMYIINGKKVYKK